MNLKAVSPVIAVVLMIGVTVTISIVVYVYSSGYTTEKTGAESETGNYKFLIETRDVNSTCIRNVGTKISFDGTTEVDFLALFDIYVNDVFQSSGVIDSFTTGNGDDIWDKSEIIIIDFDESTISSEDQIKLVHRASGTLIPFVIK